MTGASHIMIMSSGLANSRNQPRYSIYANITVKNHLTEMMIFPFVIRQVGAKDLTRYTGDGVDSPRPQRAALACGAYLGSYLA